MSNWWIGVKGGKFTTFEATSLEALSEDFEMQFGIAFGSYRSKEQAESGVKEHRATLIKLAKNVVESRRNQPELPQSAPISAEKAQEEEQITQINPFSVFFSELNELKVNIVRVIEAGKLLREYIEEKSEDKDS